jgi:hypothetical protein
VTDSSAVGSLRNISKAEGNFSAPPQFVAGRSSGQNANEQTETNRGLLSPGATN